MNDEIVGYICPECLAEFLVAEAPLGRLPEHKPSDDQSRELPCPKSGVIGIEVTARVPVRRGTIYNGLYTTAEPLG